LIGSDTDRFADLARHRRAVRVAEGCADRPAPPGCWGDFDLAAPSSIFVASPVEIATALSRIPRFNGWGTRAYSVAEHSILCDEIARTDGVPAIYRRAILFQDAPEIYWGDDTRPKKALVPALQAFEDRIALAIAERFDIPVGYGVAAYDDLALAVEWRELFPDRAPLPGLPDPGIWQAPRLDPAAAALEFVRRA
jgi:hypothetical protein